MFTSRCVTSMFTNRCVTRIRSSLKRSVGGNSKTLPCRYTMVYLDVLKLVNHGVP